MTDAARWWAGRPLMKFYAEEQPYRHEMAERILAEEPVRVLEVGCNVGGTLRLVKRRAPAVELVGIDVNAAAVAYGRKRWGLDLVVGDESWLAGQPDDAFDVAFTVSVLDHMPDPGPALEQLDRVGRTLLLLEPWTGAEGEAEGARNPYTWSWDIPARLRALGRSVKVRRMPIGDSGLGAAYRLYRATRKQA